MNFQVQAASAFGAPPLRRLGPTRAAAKVATMAATRIERFNKSLPSFARGLTLLIGRTLAKL
jgi:hypothetical protein